MDKIQEISIGHKRTTKRCLILDVGQFPNNQSRGQNAYDIFKMKEVEDSILCCLYEIKQFHQQSEGRKNKYLSRLIKQIGKKAADYKT